MRSVSFSLILAVLLTLVLAISGCTQPTQAPSATAPPETPTAIASPSPNPTVDPAKTAAAAYQENLSQAKADLARLNDTYAEITGTMLDSSSFKVWLQKNRNQTIALLADYNSTLAAADAYGAYLDANSTELATVVTEMQVLQANADLAKVKYNDAVYNYRKFWGGDFTTL